MAAMTSPAGSSAGMSFSEWTAQSMRPSSSAASISWVNRPLPPISASVRSWIRSPVVVISTSSAAASSPRARAMAARTVSAWATESFEPRAPMRMGCFAMGGRLPHQTPLAQCE